MTERVLFEGKELRTINPPTVKAEKSMIEVLQEIRQEIDEYLYDNEFGSEYRADVASIIDKHINQIEGSDAE